MKIVCASEAEEFGIVHNAHKDHFCTIIVFSKDDKNFWEHKKEKPIFTWMPKDIEVFALLKMMLGISPRFRALFNSEFSIKNLNKGEIAAGVVSETSFSNAKTSVATPKNCEVIE